MQGECPFCGTDPFHYVDNGVGMEAVAVICCEDGIAFFGRDEAPEDITEMGRRLGSLMAARDTISETIEHLRLAWSKRAKESSHVP